MSKYGVFIIESLRGEDFFDGENLSEILNLSDIPNIYREALSKNDFKNAINEFKNSNYRYLHISCHADMSGIEINSENISNKELSIIFKDNVKRKRLFLSACKGGNRNIATAFISKCNGLSVIGTPIDLYFDKAVLFWPSFYHVINNIDKSKMTNRSVSKALKRCVNLFEIPINYYRRIDGEKKYIRRYKFRKNSRASNRRICITRKL